MSQSTPLEKLDGPGANDASLVNKILSDMNEGSGQSMGNPNGAAFEQGPPRLVLQEPPIQSTQEYTMDPAPATAHLIGNSTPSAQDFSSMMASFGQVQQENPVPQVQMIAPTQKGDMWTYISDRLEKNFRRTVFSAPAAVSHQISAARPMGGFGRRVVG